MRFNFLIPIFLLSGFFFNAFATNHYIDKNASGNNNGTSWNNAWQSFGAINWNSIYPGDVIYISGSTNSLVYNEKLDILVSGASGDPITFTKSNESSHSGEVIIDVNQIFSHALDITGQDYIIVRDIHLRNAYDSVIKIKSSKNIHIENCYVHTTVRSGINISENENITISGCTITTGQSIPHQTDGIYSQNNVNNIYEYNHIVISNNDTGGHDDCIQSYRDASLTIRNNYTEQNNSKTTNAQGIYVTTPVGSDTTRIYNNIFNATLSSSNGIVFNRVTGSTSARVQIIGNTVYGENLSNQYRAIGTTDPIIKNNIGYSINGIWVFNLADVRFTDQSYIDNNIWKCSNNEPIIVNGSSESWNSWQASGFDLHSYLTDPQFQNISEKNFRLKETSDGIDNGQYLHSPYNFDFDGKSRPRKSGWDIGAFEYDGEIPVDEENILPESIVLHQNYPNPFNPSTTISFTIPEDSNVKLSIFDLLGKQISVLVDSEFPAGTNYIPFNAGGLSSGIYFYRMETNNFVDMCKMIIMK
ncbi:MAG: T9SS type A sorting domain-containing protein [Ignavibacteria bacterium]|jgi:hypothetical protein